MQRFDLIICGGGPAGASCAITAARSGREILVLERARFPRDKVCGDCLNPACWPVLERLGVAEAVRKMPHARFEAVTIITAGGREFCYDLPAVERGETGVRRRDLDAVLLAEARRVGVTVLEETAVTRLERVESGWRVRAGDAEYLARQVVAADGRNSSVARCLGLLPPARRERVGLQTHLPEPPAWRNTVRMNLFPEGYAGGASVGDGLWNLCLVARADDLERLKARAASLWNVPETADWRSIAPLTRAALPAAHPAHPGLLLVGDVARVVEPFTGEGIYYALHSGELAGECVAGPDGEALFAAKHRSLYRGRLWVNQLARLAVLHPVLASRLLENLPLRGLLARLSAKVMAPPGWPQV